MKILFFIDHIGGGGRERRMAQLVLVLDQIADVKMMTVTSTSKVDYTEVLDSSMEIQTVTEPSHIKRIKCYDDIIKKFKPDIIHLWSETSLYCIVLPILAKKYGCKFIVGFVADGRPLLVHPFIQRLCIRFAFHYSNAIVSNSKAGLTAKDISNEKSYVIYNGFDKKRLKNIDIKEKRSSLGIASKRLVTMCARVDPAKDWDMFIGLAEACLDDNIFFLAVGGGKSLDYYINEVERRRLNNIKFIGRRSDVMEIISATDVSVLFTNTTLHKEGVSNSIMESMAAGIPVIATDGGGTPEIITNGENGFVITPGDLIMAKKQLNALLMNDSLRYKMGFNAKETIENYFSLEKMGREYLALYQNLL